MPRDLEAQVWDELDRELDEIIPVIAAEEGLARGATRVSPEKEVELWGQRDPRVDRDSLKQMLMQGRVPPEWVDEQSDQRLAVIREHPEMATVFAEPLDDEMAEIVAGLAEYPYTLSILKPYEDDPKGAVAKANSVNARWQRRAGMVEPTAPAPPSPVVPSEPTDTPEPTIADPYTLATRVGGGA
jgi:hypothetical protein